MMPYNNGYYPQVGDTVIVVNAGGYSNRCPDGTLTIIDRLSIDGEAVSTRFDSYMYTCRFNLVSRADGTPAKDCKKNEKPKFNGRVVRD